jgi:hypothetical protein
MAEALNQSRFLSVIRAHFRYEKSPVSDNIYVLLTPLMAYATLPPLAAPKAADSFDMIVLGCCWAQL